MNETQRQELRALVNGAYDLQKLRVSMGNRLCAAYRVKLGQEPGDPQKLAPAEAQKILKLIKASYKKMTDGIKTELPRLKNFVGNQIIGSYAELALVELYLNIEKDEDKAFDRLEPILKEFPIYTSFMEPICGLGAQVAGVLIADIDISQARYPSSLWQLCGYGTTSRMDADGNPVVDHTTGQIIRDGVTRQKHHLVSRQYRSKEGQIEDRMGLAFNPRLKTKLHVMAEVFIQSGRREWTAEQKKQREKLRDDLKLSADSSEAHDIQCKLDAMIPLEEYKNPYTKMFYDYKTRLEHSEKYGIWMDSKRAAKSKRGKKGEEDTQGYAPAAHRLAMAQRYMIKAFLVDLYNAWRRLEGFTVAPTYAEAKLGRIHNGPSDERI